MPDSTTASDPRAWLAWVEALTTAAKRIQYAGVRPKPIEGEDPLVATDAVYGMLLGYAIECALKGVWSAAGNKFSKTAR